MRILITGATGFVGSHLRRYFLTHTDGEIVGTSYPDTPPPPEDPQRETLHFLDLRDAEATRALLAQSPPDYIIHLAAQSHVPTSYQDPWGTLENNIRGQLNLLEGCKTLHLTPRTLVIGSGEEYGRAGAAELPLTENHPLRPENPYSVSKVAQDVLGYQYFISFGLPIIRMRPFNHVGPGQSVRFVLPAFASQVADIEAGRQTPVMRVGNLTPARDFTDVRDVVRAYHLALTRGVPGEVYNIASGTPRTIQSLVDYLITLATVPIRVEIDPQRYRPADVPVIYGSAAKLQRDTGWKPEIPFEQTIQDVLDEWRQFTAGG
ncbi:MAG TPA: GDP-mannose 4,6-dehydratase [Anaerolineae bacterium]|nr:GDP-mannose 4,6-dehydratase [Anaerolineae bacterium]HQH38266.1 GDP-mannose 4,6-dehydratase [Anaerolineae bacterium]